MAKLMKRCRVCGKEYEACRSIKTGSTVFNWREVTCSPECGTEYLRLINISRGNVVNSDPGPEHESVRYSHRSSHRSKSKKNSGVGVSVAEVPVPMPVSENTDSDVPETEFTEI